MKRRSYGPVSPNSFELRPPINGPEDSEDSDPMWEENTEDSDISVSSVECGDANKNQIVEDFCVYVFGHGQIAYVVSSLIVFLIAVSGAMRKTMDMMFHVRKFFFNPTNYIMFVFWKVMNIIMYGLSIMGAFFIMFMFMNYYGIVSFTVKEMMTV